MKKHARRKYVSEARRAQVEETRHRILESLAQVVAESGEGEVIFEAIAQKAGIERRTVFRYFPNREALMRAFWSWINERLAAQTLPKDFEDLLKLPIEVFSGFDRNEGIIRASLHSSTGREMRLAALSERRKSFRKAVSDGLNEVSPVERKRMEAAAHLLYSAAAWETLKDYGGLSGREAGETVSWIMQTLRDALRPRRAGITKNRR